MPVSDVSWDCPVEIPIIPIASKHPDTPIKETFEIFAAVEAVLLCKKPIENFITLVLKAAESIQGKTEAAIPDEATQESASTSSAFNHAERKSLFFAHKKSINVTYV